MRVIQRRCRRAPPCARNVASLIGRSDPTPSFARIHAGNAPIRARPAVTKRDTHDTEFRYVRHEAVEQFAAEGWELLPALDGTHHGEYSVLMRRVERGESAMSKTKKPKMPATSDPAAPAPDTEFRYVGEEDVARLVAEGWTATPAIPGSRDFAFLMQRPAPQTDSPEEMPDGLRRA